jgi:probable rRNA maturation factor
MTQEIKSKTMPDGLQISLTEKKWRQILPSYRSICRKAIASVINLKNAEVSISLANDVFVHKLNLEYRHIDKSTNVLSFPMPFVDVPMRPMGDIVLALETVEKEAFEQNKSFEAHLVHLLIHGALHLSGYDHISEDDAKEMEALEVEKMILLGYKNPYEGEIR